MTINLSVPQTMQELRPRITVVGVGGAGCNAVNNMLDASLEGVDFLVANTDGQSLAHSLAPRKIQLGSQLTGGLGAGSKPEIGCKAAEESLDDILAELADCNMVFITAGMGGGTGTGAAPVIAKAARERGILTVGVVTKPFDFEGKRRMEQAEAGVEALQAYVDTLIVIPNQNLFRLANERTTLADTFHMADTVLHQGVCGITDLMIKPGLINLDFADIRSVMSEMGKAMMGTGEAEGESRAIDAAESAINNPLLDDSSMKGAKAVLINITGGRDMTLFEIDEAANRIRSEVDSDATIIFGSAFDDKLEGVMRVSVVATGIDTFEQNVPLPFADTHTRQASQPGQGALAGGYSKEAAVSAEPAAHTIPSAPSDMPAQMTENAFFDKGELSVEMHSVTLNDVSAEQPEEQSADLSKDPLGAPHDMFPSPLSAEQTHDNGQENLDNEADAKASEGADNSENEGTIAPATGEASETRASQEHQQATIIRQPAFIPDAPKDVGLDDEVAVADTMTKPSRPSLMNKISGLWSAKPAPQSEEANKADSNRKEEPSLDGHKLTLPRVEDPVILALPEADMEQTSLPVTPINQSEDHDDDLDIPAFLRRQAN